MASRFLTALAGLTPLLGGIGQVAVVDIDDTIVEVHGYAKDHDAATPKPFSDRPLTATALSVSRNGLVRRRRLRHRARSGETTANPSALR